MITPPEKSYIPAEAIRSYIDRKLSCIGRLEYLFMIINKKNFQDCLPLLRIRKNGLQNTKRWSAIL